MRRLTFSTAMAVILVSQLVPEVSAATVAEPPPAEVQEVGPGQYSADTKTFKLTELDVSNGLIMRKHGVTVLDSGLAQPQSAPASRPEAGVFGPGWHAEFAGGQINRKLEAQNGAIVVTDLEEGVPTRYALKSSLSLPNGGGIQTYQSADGSKVTETTKWDAAAGALRTTMTETIPLDEATRQADDATWTNPDGSPVSADDLTTTYTWQRQSGLPAADNWRVTGVGTAAYGTRTVGYDSQGRVSSVREPAGVQSPEALLTFKYATATTATGTSFGDYAGRIKEIAVALGAEAPQTQARYAYDEGGLLRAVTDPSVAATQATYAYDAAGRLASIDSATNGAWRLSFPAGATAPVASATDAGRPVSGEPAEGPAGADGSAATEPSAGDFLPDGVDPPQSYPSKCNTAKTWMWYTKSGCTAFAYHHGWKWPGWKRTASGFKVRGIYHDHCTSPTGSRPGGFDFRPACDSHDYGYGLITNKKMKYKYYLDRNRKADVDAMFFGTMYDKVCGGYFIITRPTCRGIAIIYYDAVRRFGNPQ
ncbi:phospholipase A2 [Streptosporangium pseudovulgare]|uniref:Phospholipase n=1 Tax=Streptosporangium pseudovulgare TaxID=35765 RepID=A0ABQ2RNU6_9ACTN|nr:phospholipase A2 [Streptosporangium pseudovulgare]GGQ34879.1 hypothetical protein GCM10010140_76230 [Streptosporangium pseudovulgare]